MSTIAPGFSAEQAIDFITKRLDNQTVDTKENLADIMAEESAIMEPVKNLTRDIQQGTLFYDASYPNLNETLSLFLYDLKKIAPIFFNPTTKDKNSWDLLEYYVAKKS